MSTDIAFSIEDRRKHGYFTVDNVLLDIYGRQLGPHGIAVYCALARFANSEQECWPGHATIAERTGMSKPQVKRELAKLADLGIISITPRYNPETKTHQSNLYALLDIVGGGFTQNLGGRVTQNPPGVTQNPRTKPTKNDTPTEKNKSYRPHKYSDIILG